MNSSFAGEEMASGYAQHRPLVHARVFKLLEARGGSVRVGRALDLGCGAGLSTRVLQGRAAHAIGLDPSLPMLHWAKKFVPDAEFLRGAAEAIPLGNGTVELVTAAGSLNYTDPEAFFSETARVLTPNGRLLISDFEPGKSFCDGPDLDWWFEEFLSRYPWPEGDGREVRPEVLGTASNHFELGSAGALPDSDRDDAGRVRGLHDDGDERRGRCSPWCRYRGNPPVVYRPSSVILERQTETDSLPWIFRPTPSQASRGRMIPCVL